MTNSKITLPATTAAPFGEWQEVHLEVAQRRLQECADRPDALNAVREIVTNLLGSEEIALFKVEPQEPMLKLFWSFGIDAERHRTLDVSRSVVLQRVMEGELYLEGAFAGAPGSGTVAGFRTLVPIRFDGQIVAVLAIRCLLPQKTCFEDHDVQVLRLLSGTAGEVLFGGNRCV